MCSQSKALTHIQANHIAFQPRNVFVQRCSLLEFKVIPNQSQMSLRGVRFTQFKHNHVVLKVTSNNITNLNNNDNGKPPPCKKKKKKPTRLMLLEGYSCRTPLCKIQVTQFLSSSSPWWPHVIILFVMHGATHATCILKHHYKYLTNKTITEGSVDFH